MAQNRKVIGTIMSGEFDAVWIHGYASLNTLVAVAAARARRMPVLLREEATLLDGRPALTRVAKQLLLTVLFRHVYGLYIGSQNKRFFQRYGIPDHKLFWTPYTVDNTFFQTQADELIPQRAALRKSYGIRPNVPLILFCGKLIPKKDPVSLVKAFALVRRTTECALLFAGDGPLRGDITDLVRREVIPDVHIAGFLNQSQISQAYAMADMLVLPSTCRETWGLVVNEAMNFGLPIVVSDKVGCAGDLVLHGQNGDVVPAGSISALGQSLGSLVTDANRRRAFGDRSRHIVDGWGVEHSADGIVSAALAAARRQPRVERNHRPSRVLEAQETNQEEV